MSAAEFLPKSSREDLTIQDLEPFVADILGVYYTAVAHHDAIQVLALSGHSLDSMILLRSHLESVFTFFYITEPEADLEEVFRRTEEYRDWVVVKMKQNWERSSKLNILRAHDKGFGSIVTANYDSVKTKYEGSPSDFARLERLNGFLTKAQRERLARTFDIEDFYHHIYAESSASIHFADIGDRMQEIAHQRYRFIIRYKHGAFWYVTLSNILQFKCLMQFGVFFGIESILTQKLEAILVPKDQRKPTEK